MTAITPHDIPDMTTITIPEYVIEIFNQHIIKNYDYTNNYSIVLQKNIINDILYNKF